MAADGRPADMFGQARTPQKGGPGPIVHRCAREGCGKPFASCGIGETWFCVGGVRRPISGLGNGEARSMAEPWTRKEVIGDCTLLLADCRDVLPTLGKVDAVLTDPPYGIGQDGGRGHRKRSRARVQEKRSWDACRPSGDVFTQLLAMSGEQIIWGGNYFADLLPPTMGWLYWSKLIGGDFSDGELAWTSRNRALKEFAHRKTNAEMEHPTQKPIELMRWCLGFIPDAKTILDPFMGSGTTGVACVNLGRKFIGIEREPSYFDIAVRRIEEAYKQPRLFDEPPPKPVQPGIFDGEAA